MHLPRIARSLSSGAHSRDRWFHPGYESAQLYSHRCFPIFRERARDHLIYG